MMLTAVIIDDEAHSVDVLKNLLDIYCPNVKVIGQADHATAGRKLIAEHAPDIVFLDIEMPFGTGFDMLDAVEHKNTNVIFVTAYDHYALKAIKYYAIDYLLKPVDIDELKNAVKKVAERKEQQSASALPVNLLKTYLEKGIDNSKIALPMADGLQFVNRSEIVRCEACGNYTRIYLQENRTYMVARTLGEYEELLSPYNFLRIHHAHLINLDHIERYVRGEGGYVIMSDGAVVDISRRKKQDFLNRFDF
ncbi:MAG TPA: LytTR family DNA-binding domain-containing protein [Chitinophagaceae bacterium]|nr:LytTR family DNA-binding domain-containing protein [Chitinophagaceae bacterium]